MEQLEALLAYIALNSPVEAGRFARKVFQRAEQLREHPESGGLVQEDPQRRYREILQGRYRIIYRFDGERVLIITVHHGARLLSGDDFKEQGGEP